MIRKSCLVFLLLCLFGGTGCTNNSRSTSNQVKLDVEETAYKIAQVTEFESTYSVDTQYLQTNYEFDPGLVANYSVLYGTVIDANRLALFEVESTQQKEMVKKSCELMKQQLIASFPTTLTQQIQQAENASVIEKGNYILFLSGNKSEEGKKFFEELFLTQ